MAREYKLLNALVPTISNTNAIEKDPGVGGIKLEIEINEEGVRQVLFFIKPYKQHVAASKEECRELLGRNAWGNTKSLLSNVWFSSPNDYKTIDEINEVEYRMSLHQVEDTILISHLNKQLEDLNNNTFVILSDEEKQKYTKKRTSNPIKQVTKDFLISSVLLWNDFSKKLVRK